MRKITPDLANMYLEWGGWGEPGVGVGAEDPKQANQRAINCISDHNFVLFLKMDRRSVMVLFMSFIDQEP
jgi:hypothetical protein